MARKLAGRSEDEVLRLLFLGGPKSLGRPKTPGKSRKPLKKGDEFEATWLWVRQHWPHFLAHYFQELGSKKSKPKPKSSASSAPADTDDDSAAEPGNGLCNGTTKSGKPCKRKATAGEFCSTHAEG